MFLLHIFDDSYSQYRIHSAEQLDEILKSIIDKENSGQFKTTKGQTGFDCYSDFCFVQIITEAPETFFQKIIYDGNRSLSSTTPLSTTEAAAIVKAVYNRNLNWSKNLKWEKQPGEGSYTIITNFTEYTKIDNRKDVINYLDKFDSNRIDHLTCIDETFELIFNFIQASKEQPDMYRIIYSKSGIDEPSQVFASKYCISTKDMLFLFKRVLRYDVDFDKDIEWEFLETENSPFSGVKYINKNNDKTNSQRL
jgi:hypothetical protein